MFLPPMSQTFSLIPSFAVSDLMLKPVELPRRNLTQTRRVRRQLAPPQRPGSTSGAAPTAARTLRRHDVGDLLIGKLLEDCGLRVVQDAKQGHNLGCRRRRWCPGFECWTTPCRRCPARAPGSVPRSPIASACAATRAGPSTSRTAERLRSFCAIQENHRRRRSRDCESWQRWQWLRRWYLQVELVTPDNGITLPKASTVQLLVIVHDDCFEDRARPHRQKTAGSS